MEEINIMDFRHQKKPFHIEILLGITHRKIFSPANPPSETYRLEKILGGNQHIRRPLELVAILLCPLNLEVSEGLGKASLRDRHIND